MVTVVLIQASAFRIPAAMLAAVPLIITASVIIKYRSKMTAAAIIAALTAASATAGAIMHLTTSSPGVTLTITNQSISITAPLNPGITVSKEEIQYITIGNPIKSGLKPTTTSFGMKILNLLMGWFKLSNGANAYIVATNINNQAIIVKEKNGAYIIIATPKLNKIIKTLREYGYAGLMEKT